jgi:hypothetical protein
LLVIMGIVLSIVAIWFTFAVDRRSRSVTEQMINSLQKVESSVERSSADTQGLIKVAWDRMLGGVATPEGKTAIEPSVVLRNDVQLEQLMAGLTAEVRSELASQEQESPASPDVDEIVRRVTEAVQAQLNISRSESGSASSQIDDWIVRLRTLSPAALELIRYLGAFGHLTRQQYERLAAHSRYGTVVEELRKIGALSPFLSRAETEDVQPVYWFSRNVGDNLRIAFELLDPDFKEERASLGGVLKEIGYINEASQPGKRGWNARSITLDGRLLKEILTPETNSDSGNNAQ